MNKPVRSRETGFAVAMVLVAIVILSVMGVGLLSLGLRGRVLAVRDALEISARCAADAGLTKAVFEMNERLKAKPWSDDIDLPQAIGEVLPNCGATYSYTVTGDAGGGFTVEATGRAGSVERTVRTTLPLQGPFEYAIFTKASVGLKNGGVVDWYNYDDDDETFAVGTNTTKKDSIKLSNHATIEGDIVVGYGGVPDVVVDLKKGATVTGEIYPLTGSYSLLPVTVPENLQLMPSQGVLKGSEEINKSAKYDKIDLKKGETVTINGSVSLYVIGDVKLGNSAQLQVVDQATNPNASLTLFLGGDFEGKKGSDINNRTKNAKKLKIYGLNSCEKIVFKNSSDFYGAICAPDADVTFHNSANAFGAVVGQNFEQKNSAAFYYDASLREVGVNDEAVCFVVERWGE